MPAARSATSRSEAFSIQPYYDGMAKNSFVDLDAADQGHRTSDSPPRPFRQNPS